MLRGYPHRQAREVAIAPNAWIVGGLRPRYGRRARVYRGAGGRAARSHRDRGRPSAKLLLQVGLQVVYLVSQNLVNFAVAYERTRWSELDITSHDLDIDERLAVGCSLQTNLLGGFVLRDDGVALGSRDLEHRR